MANQIAPVGAERDAQVAEVVFGDLVVCFGTWYRGVSSKCEVPRYSTNLRCALDVLLKFDWAELRIEDGIAQVHIRGQRGNVPHWYRGTGDTLAARITDAALRAKLQEAKGNAIAPPPEAPKETGGVTNYDCPNCGGIGWVSPEPGSPSPQYPRLCPVCNGKRVLSSEDELGEAKGCCSSVQPRKSMPKGIIRRLRYRDEL